MRDHTCSVKSNDVKELIREPSYEEIRDLALRLYFAKNLDTIQPSDGMLKVRGYWTKAKLILQGKMEMPKCLIPKAFYSKEAHLERLKELLNWAKENEQIQKCLKNKAFKKAARLIAEEAITRYGVDKKYAVQYAKMVLARLKSKVEIQTKWGPI